jgi:hypothetical protein
MREMLFIFTFCGESRHLFTRRGASISGLGNDVSTGTHNDTRLHTTQKDTLPETAFLQTQALCWRCDVQHATAASLGNRTNKTKLMALLFDDPLTLQSQTTNDFDRMFNLFVTGTETRNILWKTFTGELLLGVEQTMYKQICKSIEVNSPPLDPHCLDLIIFPQDQHARAVLTVYRS